MTRTAVLMGAVAVTARRRGFDRDAFQSALKGVGVPTAVYYPKPLHLQTAYRAFPVAGNGLPLSWADGLRRLDERQAPSARVDPAPD